MTSKQRPTYRVPRPTDRERQAVLPSLIVGRGSSVVFNYHGIEEREDEYPWTDAEKTYVLSREVFERQIKYLFSRNTSALSLDQLDEWLKGKDYPNPALLTFDDGHLSHFKYAAPCLRENHGTGIFFVSAGLVGRKHQMGWTELKELLRQGFEIGSHGLRHIPLVHLSEDELEKEISQSKKILEDRLGAEVKSFSIPRGFDHPRIKERAAKAGYRFLFNSRFDLVRRGKSPLGLARLAVRREFSFETFVRLAAGDLGKMKYSERIKEWTRRWVPSPVYAGLAEIKSRAKQGVRR